MSLLLRLLGSPRPWQQMIKNKEVDAAVADPPPWAVREFTPAEQDGAGLSVFEAADVEAAQDTAELVAGAFAFHQHPVENGRWIFVAVQRAELEAAGLTVVSTGGALLHKTVDLLHREVVLAGLAQLSQVAQLYLKSNLIYAVDGADAAKAARLAARTDQLSYLKLYKRGDRTQGGKNLVRFVSEQIVNIKGIGL